MAQRRFIRMLVPYSKTIFFLDYGREFGTAVETGQALEQWLNKGQKKAIHHIRVSYVPVARDDLTPALLAGRGDIIFANLTITPDRQQLIDFSDPLAKGVMEVLVTGSEAPTINRLHDLAG